MRVRLVRHILNDIERTPGIDYVRTFSRRETLSVRVVSGPDQGRALVLGPGAHLVGKGEDCHLILTDNLVSRRHLELWLEGGAVAVRDLDSTNGSFYHGARFSQVTVGAGALIAIGDSQLRFEPTQPEAVARAGAAQGFGDLLGCSPKMVELFGLLERISASSSTLLIEGETGTGKELCARAIHNRSARLGPFVICDLAAIPRTLMESEVFGHVKGAFTGALTERTGAFELAQGGTLLLDEIGELDLDLQPRLLRAIEQHVIHRVGSSHYQSIDVRIIAATNRDLTQEVAAGRFRHDLYHRLAVVRLRMPPLRERKEDIRLLVGCFLGSSGVEFSPASMALLEQHDWPGNIRELRNLVERAVALAPAGAVIDPHSLQLATEVHAAATVPTPSPSSDGYHDAKRRIIETWERSYVEQVLAQAGGNISEAARHCGLGRAYLHRLIRKYGLHS